MDRLTRGIIKLEPELLDELGLMTRLGEASSAYALQLGKPVSALTTLEKRQGFMNAIMAEGELKFGGVSDAAGNLKNYDKLAATFADLTKTVFGFINAIGGLNIAGFFADNMAVLGGAAVLFLSTLKSQLLPGILSITAAATKATAEARKDALKENTDISKAHASLGSNPAFLKPLADAGFENAGPQLYAKAVSDAQAAIAKETAELEKNTGTGKKAIALREKQAQTIRDYKEALTEVYQSQVANAALSKAENAQAAVMAASNLNLVGTVRGISASKAAYRTELELTNLAAGRSIVTNIGLKVSLHGIRLAAQAAGAALLSAMSWIGIAFVAIGALVGVFKALQSEQQKLENKKAKELTEIYSQLGDKLKELERIGSSGVSAHMARQAAITLEANAVKELADKYAELQAARSANGGPQARTANGGRANSTANWWDVAGASSLALLATSAPAGVRNRAMGSAVEASESRRLGVVRGSASIGAIQNAQDAQAFDALSRLNPEKAASLLKTIRNLSEELQARTINDAFQEMTEKLEKLREVTTRFDAANKSAADSLKKLAFDALPKTPFDAAITGLQAFNKALSDLIQTASAADVAKYISSIDQEIGNYLTTAGQKFITDQGIVENLAQQERTVAGLNTQQAASLVQARQRLAVSGYTQETLQAEARAVQHTLELAQQQVIVAANRGKLLAAQIEEQKVANSYTVEGLQQEMNMQNAIIANENIALELQKEQLNLQLVNIDRRIEEQRAQLIAYEAQKAQFKYIQDQYLLIEESAQRRREIELDVFRLQGNGSPVDDILNRSSETAAALLARRRALEETKVTLTDDERKNIESNINDLLHQRQIISLGIESVQLSITTNNMRALNAAEQELRIAELREKIEERRKKIVNEITEIYISNNRAIEDFNSLLSHATELEKNVTNIARRRADTVASINESARQEQVKLDRDLANAQNAATARVRAANIRLHADQTQQNAERATALIAQANLQADLQTRAALYFSEYKEGLEWQKQSLDYLQRAVEEQNKLTELVQTEEKLRRELSRKRQGIVATEQTTAAEELIAQTAAHRLLVSGVEIKKALIDLEFALLEQQRQNLVAELNLRRTSPDISNQALAQVNESLRTIQSINLPAAAALAKEAIDQSVRNSALSLRLNAMEDGPSNRFDLRGIFQGFSASQNARADAMVAAVEQSNGIVKAVLPGIREAELSTQDLRTTEANRDYDVQIEIRDGILRLEAATTAANDNATPFTSRSSNPATLAGMVAAEIERRYPGVLSSEHSTQGGTSRRNGPSYHNSDRALDVNVGRGNVEWNNPQQRAVLQQIQRELRETYGDAIAESIFGAQADHLDHLHVAFRAGFTDPIVRAITESAPEIAAATTAALSNPAGFERGSASTGSVAFIKEGANLSGTASLAEGNNAAPLGSAKVDAPLSTITPTIKQVAIVWDSVYAKIFADLESLGPEGKALAIAQAGISSFAQNIEAAMVSFRKGTIDEKIQAAAGLASNAVSTLQGVLAAASEAKISGIDREIAAEQKRDGKSAESVAKLAALEKKKDAIARKQFEMNKKLMMAQAVISTAAGIAGALAASSYLTPPVAMAMAAMIGVMGAAQLAVIAGSSYQSASPASATASTPSTLSIGKRGDSVDLAKNNPNAGGEIGYLRGTRGRGSNASNYSLVGSAYGGSLSRGYGNTAFVVGEHGPETITPDTPITVRPSNDNADQQRALPPVNINIQALDAKGVEEILYGQRGNIIGMLREAANNSGQTFLENVNTQVYNKPNVGRL
jgi:hypothetical protein